jgi:predicted small lipoprotein YifL
MKAVLCLAGAMLLALTAACGQKGALYLPPRNGTVVTRPAGAAGAPPQSDTKTSDDKDSENNSQNPQTPKQP